MLGSSEAPGSSLGKITRWWQKEKAARPQTREAQNTYQRQGGLGAANNKTLGLGRTLASKGNRGDTMLAHINPEEAELLKMMGGSGTVNPKTGLLQFDPIFQPTGFYNAVGEWEESPLRGPTYTDSGQAYLKANPDVANDPFFSTNPLAHYQQHGEGEGRTWETPTPLPVATPSSSSAYLKANPDVAAAGADPWEHYNQFGKNEGRTWEAPRAYYQDYTYGNAGYDQYVKDYSAKYPENESPTDKLLREARNEEFTPDKKSYWEWLIGDDPKPQSDSDEGYRRYLAKYDSQEGPSESYQSPQQRGMADKRLSYDEWYDIYGVDAPKEPTKYTSGPGEHLQKTDADYRPPAGWDPKLYLEKNPDLLDDPWAAANPLAHYRTFGEDEGRGRVAGGYDKANFGQANRLYLERNPDLLEKATSYTNAAKKYLEDNPDVAAADKNPWEHYQSFGKGEGRKWEGEGKFDPWEHYELHGKDEGRKWQGEEPKINFSNVRLPAQYQEEIARGIRAVKDGYYIVPQGGAADIGMGGKPGEKIAVDRYGWIKTPDESGLPAGSYYNVLTHKYLLPEDGKPSMNNTGRALPDRPKMSEFDKFIKSGAMGVKAGINNPWSPWKAASLSATRHMLSSEDPRKWDSPGIFTG